MPRILPFNFTPPAQRLFHNYARLQNTHNPPPNHYETLKISPSATPAEVKKSFYSLSKAHHPDLHPSDPHASQRFVRISEAYTILGTPAKRAQYDQQFHSHNSHHGQHSQHKGSYHSSGPAGGRPPSGLSRRRTHFQGPPPSFYRSGGWGNQASKRQSAQEGTHSSSSSSTSSNPSSTSSTSTSGPAKAPGMGPGSQPFHQEVPHFDWREHLRTHENHSRRQRDRRRMMGDPLAGGGGIDEGPGSTLVNMLFVGGIILLAGWLPYVFVKDVVGVGGKRKKE